MAAPDSDKLCTAELLVDLAEALARTAKLPSNLEESCFPVNFRSQLTKWVQAVRENEEGVPTVEEWWLGLTALLLSTRKGAESPPP